MSTAVRNIDEQNWSGLHENLVLSEKYFSGCEKCPQLFERLHNDERREQVKDKMVKLLQQLKEAALATFKTVDQQKLFDRMHEVLRSLYILAAVYRFVLRYKAQFQQAISLILVKAATMQGGGQYLLTLGKSLGKPDFVEGVADVELLGNMLIADFAEFKAINTMRFKRETSAQLALEACQIRAFAVRSMTGGGNSAEEVLMPALVQGYHRYKALWLGLFQRLVYAPADGDPLRLDAALKPLPVPTEWNAGVKLTADAMRDGAFRLLNVVSDKIGPCAVSTWTAEHRQLVVPLMGAIFAYYSFQKSGENFDNVRGSNDSEIDKMDVVMEPHSIQAVSILRMLGCHAVGTVVVSETDARIGDGMKVAGTYQQVAENVFQHSEHLYDTSVPGRKRFVPVVWKNDAGEWELIMAEFLLNRSDSRAPLNTQDRLLEAEGTCLFKGEDLNSTWSSSDKRTCKVCYFPKEENTMRRQLLQIGTGEGKSITLACCATILALMGFRVRCVCYSQYLCSRDYQDFVSVFEHFHVKDRIQYKTLHAYCEEITLREGSARQLVSNLFHGCVAQGKSALDLPKQAGAEHGPWHLNDEEILLMDEVDVFFTKDFYGSTLDQVTCVPLTAVHKALNTIIQIWDHNLADVTMICKACDQLLSDENLIQQFLDELGNKSGTLRQVQERVVTGELRRMVTSYSAFVTAGKTLGVSERDDKDKRFFWSPTRGVGYKLDDGVSYDVTKGYQTCFAYLLEQKRGKFCYVADENGKTMDFEQLLQRRLGLMLPCGHFAYDTLRLNSANPHQPACILGVSGTLTSLASHELQILSEFGIETFTVMPSVYGAQKRKLPDQGQENVTSTLCPYILTTNEANKHVQDLVTSLCQRIDAAGPDPRRSVLVFFRDLVKLKGFLTKDVMDGLASKGIKLEQLYEGVGEDTQDNSQRPGEVRDHVIRNAAQQGVCTLCTPSFGRGSDFVSHDALLDKVGGVHVIQTFAADSCADEVQIQGRTARQGKNGSWSLILDDTELAKLDPNTWEDPEEHGAAQPACSSSLTVERMQAMSSTERAGQLQQARGRCESALAARLKKSRERALKRDVATRQFFDLLTGKKPAAVDEVLTAYQTWYCNDLGAELAAGELRHTVFVLDESGSMGGPGHPAWEGLMTAYRKYISTLAERDRLNDLLSVVQFDNGSRITQQFRTCGNIARDLTFQGGGTNFPPGLSQAADVLLQGRLDHPECTKYTLVWMTDGGASLSGVSEAFQKYAPFGKHLAAFFMFFGNETSGEQIVKQVCEEFQSVCKESSASFALAVDAAKLEDLFGRIARSSGDKLSFV